jgi:hypothetical protein
MLDIQEPPKHKPPTLRSRGRSNSIVKVEQIGDRSVEEVLDRNVYVNINADWVNAKGTAWTSVRWHWGPSLTLFSQVPG